MIVAGKSWGVTELVVSNKAFELHAIKARAGYSCSRHRHLTKYNGFYVVMGCLAIDVWKPSGTVDRTEVRAGQFTQVSPPEWHRFTALEATEALEIYWSQFDSADIERDPHG